MKKTYIIPQVEAQTVILSSVIMGASKFNTAPAEGDGGDNTKPMY